MLDSWNWLVIFVFLNISLFFVTTALFTTALLQNYFFDHIWKPIRTVFPQKTVISLYFLMTTFAIISGYVTSLYNKTLYFPSELLNKTIYMLYFLPTVILSIYFLYHIYLKLRWSSLFTPSIMYAIKRNKSKLLNKTLLSQEANPREHLDLFKSCVISNCNRDIFEILIRHGYWPSEKSLQIAISGKIKRFNQKLLMKRMIWKLIFDYGVSLAINNWHISALKQASINKQTFIHDYIIENIPKEKWDQITTITMSHAIDQLDIWSIENLIKHGIKIEHHQHPDLIMHLLDLVHTTRNSKESVQLFNLAIDAGEDVNKSDKNNVTPVMKSIKVNFGTSKLLRSGVNIFAVDILNNNILHYGMKYLWWHNVDLKKIRDLLVKHEKFGYFINHKNSHGITPLMLAAEHQSFDNLIDIVSSADIAPVDNDGNSVIHYILKNKELSKLNYKHNKKEKNKIVQTISSIVDKYKSISLDINNSNNNGIQPLFNALKNLSNHPVALHELNSMGFSLSPKNNMNGRPVLIDYLEYLIKYSRDQINHSAETIKYIIDFSGDEKISIIMDAKEYLKQKNYKYEVLMEQIQQCLSAEEIQQISYS